MSVAHITPADPIEAADYAKDHIVKALVILSTNDVENVTISHDNTNAHVTTSTGDLSLQPAAGQTVINRSAPQNIFSSLELNQYADDRGLNIYGFDDMLAKFLRAYVASTGHTYLRTSAGSFIYLRPEGTTVGWFSSTQFGFFDNMTFQFGSSGVNNATLSWQNTLTKEALVMGLSDFGGGDLSRSLIVCDRGDIGYDFAHPAQSNPTIFVHSSRQDPNEWISISHDQTDAVLESGKGDLVVKTEAGKTLKLGTPVFNDLVFSLAGAKVPAVNAPDWVAFTANLNSYTFDLNDYADLETVELLHGWTEGTDLDVHMHVVTNGVDGTDRKVKFTVYYSLGDTGEAMSGEGSLTAELTIPASTPDKTHLYLDLGDITGAGYKVTALLKLRLKRIAGTGTEPSADPFVEMVGVHYEVDTLGSRSELVK